MAETCLEPAPVRQAARGAAPFRCRIYGLQVSSEIPLRAASVGSAGATPPDVVIRRVDTASPPQPDGPAVASLRCPLHGTDMVEYRGPSGTWLWLHAIGDLHILPDFRRIDVYPCARVDDRALGLALAGPALLFVRHQLGGPSLHASAVVSGGRAIAFVGPRGRGKSTMAAAFLRRGAELLTDDALPLLAQDDGVDALPGPPYMKVWSETAQHALAISDDLPNLAGDIEKKLLTLQGRFVVASDPARLRAVYVLDRYDPNAANRQDVSISEFGRREALLTLLAHTSNRDYLLPPDDALSIPVYARLLRHAPVRLLTYPDGFEHQDTVYHRILADVERG